MDPYEELEQRLREVGSAPFLFVGAGLSIRYLGTDDWRTLLEKIAAYTSHPFAYYLTKANNDLPATATAIAEAFHEVWWKEPRFAESRDRFGATLKDIEDPLRVEVCNIVHSRVTAPNAAPDLGTELEKLREAAIDGIITTNYDPLMERLFPDFKVYVGQDQLLFADVQGVGEIYKIHGTAEEPSSVVITRRDFDGFEERNPYLAAKLLAVFVEHPVIFLGYSLTDPNMQKLLVSIASVLTTNNLARLRDRLIFVEWTPGGNHRVTQAQIAVAGFVIPIVHVEVPEFYRLFETLGRLKRKFPARLLRHLKEQIYELALNGQPSQRFAILDIDSSTQVKDIDFVIGVGIQQRLGTRGYIGLTRVELLMDVLKPVSEFEAQRVLNEALPHILKTNGYVPLYRYLRDSGNLDAEGKLVERDSLDAKVVERFENNPARLATARSQAAQAKRIANEAARDIRAIFANNTISHSLLGVLELRADEYDPEDLRKLLSDDAEHMQTIDSTAWAKATCKYDFDTYLRATRGR